MGALVALAVAACGGRRQPQPAPAPATERMMAPATTLRMEAPEPETFTVIEDPKEPFLQRLGHDLLAGWELPDLDVQPAAALACLRLDAEGDITGAIVKDSSGEATVDDSIERALFELRRRRHDTPEEVPTDLVDEVIHGWVCFRLKSG